MTTTEAPAQLIFPRLNPDQVHVFLAEDSPEKREAILSSLGEFGINNTVTVATTYDEAHDFITAQEPGALTANVFLLDGALDANNPGMLWHGRRLAGTLLGKYAQPLTAVTDKAAEEFRALGLTRRQAEGILDYRVRESVYGIARQRLQAEAVLVGVSRVHDGEIGDAAQYPWVDYDAVGEVVYQSVVPQAVRNKIAKQQRREANRARSRAMQTSRE